MLDGLIFVFPSFIYKRLFMNIRDSWSQSRNPNIQFATSQIWLFNMTGRVYTSKTYKLNPFKGV